METTQDDNSYMGTTQLMIIAIWGPLKMIIAIWGPLKMIIAIWGPLKG